MCYVENLKRNRAWRSSQHCDGLPRLARFAFFHCMPALDLKICRVLGVSPRARALRKVRGSFSVIAVGILLFVRPAFGQTATPRSFAAIVEQLSEPGGDFGGDNLVSNEQSYLHVMPALTEAGVKGGAYLGVGPDQNFSYIAQIKPEIAYIVDIRRDNLLLLLLFKALFAEAPTRVGYLCLLTGRPMPEQIAAWQEASIDKIVAYIDGAQALPDSDQKLIRSRLERTITNFGVPLTTADLETIATSRNQFVAAGLSLVFQARGQPLRSYYPTLRTLLQETDRAGHQLSFLASEPGYQFVRSLQERDLIVPVVGDVSGSQAMRAIAADMKARGLPLSAFYISNVEYYLFQNGSFARYAENLQRFPRDEHSTVIRSVFPSGGSRSLPQSLPNYYSTSIIQPFGEMLDDLKAGKYRSYRDLIWAGTR